MHCEAFGPDRTHKWKRHSGSVNSRRDDEADAETDSSYHDRHRRVTVFADFFPEIIRRQLVDCDEGNAEDQDSQRRVNYRIQQIIEAKLHSALLMDSDRIFTGIISRVLQRSMAAVGVSGREG